MMNWIFKKISDCLYGDVLDSWFDEDEDYWYE